MSRSRVSILADKAVWRIEEELRAALGPLGVELELHLGLGASFSPKVLAKAELLLTRSVTRVDGALLDQAPRLQAVVSATAGLDHIDTSLLRQQQVAVTHAPGANAPAVVEWVATQYARARLRGDWPAGPVGVLGCGQVGQRIATFFEAMGHEVLRCDPPAAEQGRIQGGIQLAQVLDRARVISAHLPLVDAGEYPTRDLLQLDALRQSDVELILNSGRGETIAAPVYGQWAGRLWVDTWRNEPLVDPKCLTRSEVQIATPHIAGYTLDSKARATRMAVDAIVDFVQGARRAGANPEPHLVGEDRGPRSASAPLGLERDCDWSQWAGRFEAERSLSQIDARLRSWGAAGGSAAAFESLRTSFELRREIGSVPLDPTRRAMDAVTARWLWALGQARDLRPPLAPVNGLAHSAAR